MLLSDYLDVRSANTSQIAVSTDMVEDIGGFFAKKKPQRPGNVGGIYNMKNKQNTYGLKCILDLFI